MWVSLKFGGATPWFKKSNTTYVTQALERDQIFW